MPFLSYASIAPPGRHSVHRQHVHAVQPPQRLQEFRKLGLICEVQMQGQSMAPALPGGTMARIHGSSEVPRVGEVVAFWDGKRVVVHRVRKVRSSARGSECRTRGDANLRSDGWIAVDLLVGRVEARGDGNNLWQR